MDLQKLNFGEHSERQMRGAAVPLYYKDISNIKKKYDTTDGRKKRVIEYINEHKTLSTEQKNYLWHETAHYDSKSPWESSYQF